MTTTGDPLDLALAGICPVEASAGTGKTFAIATLYLRFVLEQACNVDQIVVATFTRAAAAELATRLRERLVVADRLLATDDPGTERVDDDGAVRATRTLIARQLAAGIAIGVLRQRARAARLALDTACIGTLHGFCHRALAEFGFDTGQTLRPPELIDDVRALEDEIVRDFWRRGSTDSATATLLTATWGTPDALAKQVYDAHWRGRAIDQLAAGDAAAQALLAARAYLTAELPRRLAARNLMSHDTAIDRLAAALVSPRGAAIIATLRQRWKVALVDEFQDTDSVQWAIVRALFADTALVIVGDPKQAIYGFRGGDVYAWRQALADARAANPAATCLRLTRSFRSGAGLCQAFNALFSQPAGATPRAFIEPIEHPDIAPDAGVREHAVLKDGHPLAALQVWWLDPETIGHADRKPLPSKSRAEGTIEHACVAWIANTLRAPGMELRGKHGTCEALQARHIAVLVDTNRQALSLQAALGRAGIAASCNLKSSVYASAEAVDLALLLEAVAAPNDMRRARAAHASVLVGCTAAELAPLPDAGGPATDLLEAVAGWADDVRRHGPAAWLRRLLQTAAPHLLALPDGERRVANYLQLGELLQGLAATGFGGADLAARFARARVEASEDADAERLRLDTDVQAVTISTVHAAKGLEYDVVLVPYAALASAPFYHHPPVPLHWYHDDANRGRVAIGAGADATAVARATHEARAEAVRKLYVAVTRASALCVLPYGPTQGCEHSALFHVLQKAGREEALPVDAVGCRAALEELRARADGAVAIVDALPVPPATPKRTPHGDRSRAPLHAHPFDGTRIERDWSVWSFSRLVRGGHGDDTAPGAGDHAGIDAAGQAPTLAGPRFGTAVHAVFEHADFAAWRDADGVPAAQRELVERCLRDEGLPPPGMTMAEAAAIAGACISGALNAELPCGVRLCAVASTARRAEIEFHLSLAPTHTDALLELLHAHGYLTDRTRFNAATLNGLMTGKIDLTFAHAGRFHLIDWKTNLCAAYDADTLAAEITRHDYDLQWLIYTLALHRWLGQQLPGYAYTRHVGAAYYLFVRGLRAGGGIRSDAPPGALIDAMDRLFAGTTA